MLTVEIKINGSLIRKVFIHRIKGEEHERCRYEVYRDLFHKNRDSVFVNHDYDDGMYVLIGKAMKTLQKYDEERLCRMNQATKKN